MATSETTELKRYWEARIPDCGRELCAMDMKLCWSSQKINRRRKISSQKGRKSASEPSQSDSNFSGFSIRCIPCQPAIVDAQTVTDSQRELNELMANPLTAMQFMAQTSHTSEDNNSLKQYREVYAPS